VAIGQDKGEISFVLSPPTYLAPISSQVYIVLLIKKIKMAIIFNQGKSFRVIIDE